VNFARPPILAVLALVLLLAGGGAAWWFLADGFEDAVELPLPPEPPRLADGADYERCLAMLRDDPEGALSFAEAWEATGGGEGARHCSALAQLTVGEPERAAEQLERLAIGSRSGPAARAAVFAQAGQAWMMTGDPGRAFAATTMALTLSPNDPDLLTDRSVALGTMRRYSEALADLDRALAIDPERTEALVFRAAALRNLDRVDDALTAVHRALGLSPDNPEALLERGILRQLRNDTGGARADWQRVLELAPDSPAADLAQQNLALSDAGPTRR
jgi:tetratricopeptide (TPR) repeat protein